MREERRGAARAGILTAAFAAAAVSVQPLLWNVFLLIAGLPDVVLVGWAAATLWWGQLPALLPHLVAAALLCAAAALLGRMLLRRARLRSRQLASAALAGLALAAVLTHWYFGSVGGSVTPGGITLLFAVYAVFSVPWLWMGHLLAEPRALSVATSPR